VVSLPSCEGKVSKSKSKSCVLISSILFLLYQIIESKDVEFQLRITFFDTANKYFYGSTWLGPVEPPSSSTDDRFTINNDEVIITVHFG